MDRPGTWDEAEAVSAGPIRNPDSGEIGQGKEIGDQEVTQTRGPENCGQNLQDPGRAALGTEHLPFTVPRRQGAGGFSYSPSPSILGDCAA